ncbi:MAG: hypothetical protein GVY19_01505 [Bacteroidetes bacterium]|jgi:hypothetical protein|nr:hypothetical protein [Bacteroidota bacterium]
MSLRVIIVTAMICNSIITLAQADSANHVKYTPDFDFNDGVFLDFEQVTLNNPIPKSRLLTSTDFNSSDFFDELMKNKRIYFYDQVGVKREVIIDQIWGYSRNGVLYKNMQNEFFRITIVGSISHFIASHTSYQDYYTDPYYHPYYGRSVTYSVNPGPVKEMRQYILDFQTGDILEYNFKNVEALLMKDPALHAEYAGLRKKKKKQQKFIYIRKFNERNPLYFPKQEIKKQIP